MVQEPLTAAPREYPYHSIACVGVLNGCSRTAQHLNSYDVTRVNHLEQRSRMKTAPPLIVERRYPNVVDYENWVLRVKAADTAHPDSSGTHRGAPNLMHRDARDLSLQ
jgi:hypothetical protein